MDISICLGFYNHHFYLFDSISITLSPKKSSLTDCSPCIFNSQPLIITHLLFVFKICLSRTFHVNGIVQCMVCKIVFFNLHYVSCRSMSPNLFFFDLRNGFRIGWPSTLNPPDTVSKDFFYYLSVLLLVFSHNLSVVKKCTKIHMNYFHWI